MFDFLYIEEDAVHHPRTAAVCERFPQAKRIVIDRYGSIFNRKGQDFRLQKKRPALILARKYGQLVLEAPRDHGIGSSRNYYFSHMLNCLYDCRYCFLQGMYSSANMVMFVNYEEFQSGIDDVIAANTSVQESSTTPETFAPTLGGPQDVRPHFFTGYNCDSLAMESVTGFVRDFLDFFAQRHQALFELRTKSVAINPLLTRDPIDNCVVAFSLTPEVIARRYEAGAPSLKSRIDALSHIQQQGWPVGLRFDPLVHYEGFREDFRRLLQLVFERLDPEFLHSICLGPMRLPRDFHKRMTKLYPEEPLLTHGLEEGEGMLSYRSEVAGELAEACTTELLTYVSQELLFPTFIPTSE